MDDKGKNQPWFRTAVDVRRFVRPVRRAGMGVIAAGTLFAAAACGGPIVGDTSSVPASPTSEVTIAPTSDEQSLTTDPGIAPDATTPAPPPPGVTSPGSGDRSFKNCTEAWAAGAAPLLRGSPGYEPKHDRDGDGIACEQPPRGSAGEPGEPGPPGTPGIPTTSGSPGTSGGVSFKNCTEAWNAGAAPLLYGSPGYEPKHDRDGDGIACEQRPSGASGATSSSSTSSRATSTTTTAVSFKNCDEARAAGAAPMTRGAPGYEPRHDRDGDGIACE